MRSHNCRTCGKLFDGWVGMGQGHACSDLCRYWGKVDVGPDFRGCWDWTGATTGRGYGKLCVRYVFHNAHRLAFRWFHGEIPAGQFVCHRCDNKLCQNPLHLFAGTAQDNYDDMVAKGRRRHGTREIAEACGNGHAYTSETCYVKPSGKRVCRICRRAKDQRKYHRAKQRHALPKVCGTVPI